jgi:hypothetical protein
MNDVQATGEASGPLKRTSCTSKQDFLTFPCFGIFCYYNPEPDLADKKLNAALRIRIHKTVYKYVIPVLEFLGNL